MKATNDDLIEVLRAYCQTLETLVKATKIIYEADPSGEKHSDFWKAKRKLDIALNETKESRWRELLT